MIKITFKYILFVIVLAQVLLAQSVTITYDYDPIDRLTAVSYTSGETIDYTYDKAGNMTGVTHDGTTPGAALSLTPTSLSFGDQAVGTESATQTVTVTNTGSVEITSLVINEASSEYRQSTTCGSTLAAGAECIASVYFKPTSEGVKTVTLRVDSAETDEQTVSLNGTGVSDSSPTDTDGDGMSDDFENNHGLDPEDPSDADGDLDGDGYTNLEEYLAGTDPTDSSSNSLALDIVGKTKYFMNTTGTIGDRSYVDDDTYTGSFVLANSTTQAVDGTYEIIDNVLTLDRISPSASTLVLTYLGEDAGVMSFTLSIDDGAEEQSYFYDTAQERDAATNRSNPALIMYLLN